jgi:ribose transport system permease protein
MAEMIAREMAPATLPRAAGRLRGLAQSAGLLWVLLILCGVAVWLSPNFIQIGNLLNVGRQVALFGIVSVGMTFVILTRGIDLSVGSIVGVVAVASAMMLPAGVPIPVTMIAALALGALCGAANGIGVAYCGMPPFIMTLGMLVIGRGIAMTLANGEPQSLGAAADAFYFLGGGFLLGIPVPIWILAAIAFLAFVVLRHTAFGRQVYAVGSNAEAARLAGISVPRVLMSVYVISGVLSALTALIFVSRLTVGEPTAGTNLELEAISIVVIGGTSLFGGEGGVGGTVIGAAIIAVMANILNLLGISPFTQQIVKGAIILAAVGFEVIRHRRGR